jgi:hypothetical protein
MRRYKTYIRYHLILNLWRQWSIAKEESKVDLEDGCLVNRGVVSQAGKAYGCESDDEGDCLGGARHFCFGGACGEGSWMGMKGKERRNGDGSRWCEGGWNGWSAEELREVASILEATLHLANNTHF